MSEVVINVTKVEEVVTINATPNVTQILVNTNSGGGIQSVVAGTNITIDDTDPLNPIISASGGGGAVDSVNGQTGVVVLDADDISETATRFWLTNILKTAYDGAVTWISTNGTNILNHIASTSNPHSVTKSQVGLSNVVNADTTTTANITDSTNKRFVTDANLVVIGNTSGTNSGDNATNTTSNSYADAKVVAELASFKTANFIDFTSSGQGQLNGKQNISEIVSANKTAVNDMSYVVTATCTFTDPTPAEGKGYDVFVRNGIATIGGVAYSEGTEITRIYHSGSWKTCVVTDFEDWTDFSGTSVITGFVTPNITFLRYRRIGKGLTIRGRVTGISNSLTGPTLTHPFTTPNFGVGQATYSLTYTNNGASSITAGVIVAANNSNLIQFFRDGTFGTNWTNSGTLTIAFEITFIIQ